MIRGHRIGVTRAWPSFTVLLEDKGARVEVIVLTRAVPPTLSTGLDLALKDGLDDYDWVGFSSISGVDALLARVSVEQLSGCRLAAVGPATAASLVALGLEVDLVPTLHTAEGLAAELLARPVASILLPSAERGRPELAEALSAGGWDVLRVAAYSTEAVEISVVERSSLMACDVLCFLAPSAVGAWAQAVESPDVSPPLVAIGPTTASAVEVHGFSLLGTAESATPEAMVALLEQKL
ncbi:MAG: uroporphyrinogen-III synthase [Acidimicrobiales bacterium]